jgi:hypothetical protein
MEHLLFLVPLIPGCEHLFFSFEPGLFASVLGKLRRHNRLECCWKGSVPFQGRPRRLRQWTEGQPARQSPRTIATIQPRLCSGRVVVKPPPGLGMTRVPNGKKGD